MKNEHDEQNNNKNFTRADAAPKAEATLERQANTVSSASQLTKVTLEGYQQVNKGHASTVVPSNAARS